MTRTSERAADRAFWRGVLAERSTKHDTAGREFVTVGQGAAGPIYATRAYAEHRLARLGEHLARDLFPTPTAKEAT